MLTGVEACFTPFYSSRAVTALRSLGLIESTIGGNKLRARCLRYLQQHKLQVDLDGRRGNYQLVITCTDLTLPDNLAGAPLVVVQEGILDPLGLAWPLVRRFPEHVPRWFAGTAATGLSGKYQRFCVASQGYRRLFINRGADPERVVVTGIPNFDDCAAFKHNDFPRRDYVLVCTSDSRETYKRDDREAFIRRALHIAGSRPLLFKLHPNENVARARAEIVRLAPQATVFADGPTDHMIANCTVLITQWSSVAFVGMALGKEVHSAHHLEDLRRLMPEQNRSAARRIAQVCDEVLGRSSVNVAPSEAAE